MSAVGDLFQQYGDLTYWEIGDFHKHGLLTDAEKFLLQAATPDYMAMVEDIEIMESENVQ